MEFIVNNLRAFFNRPTLKRDALQIFFFVSVVIFFIGYNSIYLISAKNYGVSDLAVFYVAGSTITKRTNLAPGELYEKTKIKPAIKIVRPTQGGTKFLYLPQTTLLFAPLAVLDFYQTKYVWAFANGVILITTIILTIHYLIQDNIFKWRYSLFIFAFTFADSTESLFRSGQLNGLILLLLISSLVFIIKKKEVNSGICLAIATTLKIFPLIFLPYLLITKKWRAAISMMVTGIMIWLASIPFFGISTTINFLKNTLPYLLSGNIGYIAESTSLFGSFRMGVKHGELDWLHLSRKAIVNIGENVHIVFAVIALVGVFYVLWTYTSPPHKQKSKNLLLHFSLLILFVLLFSKSIHVAYHLWIIPTILLLLSQPLAVSAKYKAVTYQYVFAILVLLFTNFWRIAPFKLHTTLALWKPATLSLFLLFILTLTAHTKWSKNLPIYNNHPND